MGINTPPNFAMRSVGISHCEHGKNDLNPKPTDPDRFSAFLCDFEASSYHFYPSAGENFPAFCPGYLTLDRDGHLRTFADVLVVEAHGVITRHALDWFRQNKLNGAAYPTALDSLMHSSSLVLIELTCPVNDFTYARLWTKITKELFAGAADMAQSDSRHRFLYPRTSDGQSKLLSHKEGYPLHVEWALSRPSLKGEVLGSYSAEHPDEIWDESAGAPFNR